MTPRHRAPSIAIAALVLGGLAVVACVSDRSTAVTSAGTTNCTTPSSTAGAAIVFISNFAFVPPTVHVKAGQSVAWVNCETDATAHTATADGGSFDSGSLRTPDAYVRSFPTVGTFPYHCTIHPGMKASVIVE
ncbi:MAG: amidase [Gemmatimonadetes bacterium]|jgi:plastocyanin|nr:amidase [Gemmatimonadota bacterium]